MFIGLDNFFTKFTKTHGLMVSSSIIQTVPVTLSLSSCLEYSVRSIPGLLISVTAEFSNAFKTRTLVIT